MTVITKAPRHRSGTKTATPLTGITDTFVSGAFRTRGVAVASATGVALTATVTGAAIAAPLPSTLPAAPSDDFVSNLEASDSVTLVSLDVDWDPGDDVAATAAEAAPAVEEVVVEEEQAGDTTVASRDYERQETAAVSVDVPGASASGVAATALQFVGYPYVWGGGSPDTGFDCSGFTSYVFGLHGIYLPRTSYAQAGYGTVIPASEAQPGDLVLWSYGHAAIYLGDGQIVHASTPATGVKVGSLFGDYYFVRL